MAEYIPPEGHICDGHAPNLEGLVLDLHRLVTMFLSSMELARMRTERGHDPVGYLQQYEEDETTRILLSTAITARIIDDRDGRLRANATSCGELILDLRRPNDAVPLTLREACNKIIHAKKIRGDLSRINDKNYTNPIMHFYGELNGQEWKATLNVIEYAITYTESVCMYA